MNTLKERMVSARQARGLTQAELAKAVGKSQSAIAAVESGRNKETSGLISIARVLGVSPEWLETGKGDSKIGSDQPRSEDSILPPLESLKAPEDSITFRHRDIWVKCGSGGAVNADFPDIIRTLEIPREYVFLLFGSANVEHLDIVGIKGDSMEPTLPQKGLAFIDTRINYFDGDGIYAFYYSDGTYMKRLQKVPGKLVAHSDNKNYSSFEIDQSGDEPFQIIAKFRAVMPLEICML
nr:MAG TPA: Repressor protein CI [Caudoviricetes sp.]